MADAEKDALAQAAAGIDLSRTSTTEDLSPAGLAGHVNTVNEIAAIQRAERVAQYSNWDLTKDAFMGNPSVTMFSGAQSLGYENDATYGWDQFKTQFDEAKKTLPEEWLSELHGARSAAHFDFLYRRSLDHIERERRIGEAGWDGFAAQALTAMVDPITWTSWGVSLKALRAFQMTQKGWVASHAASAAWANTVVTGIEDAAGKHHDASDYMAAAGMGLILGAGFGSLSRNPALQGESAALVKVGQDLWNAGAAGVEKVKGSKAASMVGIRRAADTATPTAQEVQPQNVVQDVAENGQQVAPEGEPSGNVARPFKRDAEAFLLRRMEQGGKVADTERRAMAAVSGIDRLPGRPIERIGDDYRFRGIEVKRTADEPDGRKHFTAWKDGKQIGEMEMLMEGDRWKISWEHVDPEFRKGSGALAMLKAAEAEGAPGIPDGTLSPDSFPQWADRIWWVKDWYRPSPKTPPGQEPHMLSPKRLMLDRDLELINLNGAKADGASRKKIADLEGLVKRYDDLIAKLPPEAKSAENLAVMFSSKRDLMGAKLLRPEALEAVNGVLNRILPKAVNRRIADEIGEGIDGLADGRTVWLALNSDDPVKIAYHETVHTLRSRGLIDAKEWTALEKWAKKSGAMERYKIAERYGTEGLTPSELSEEAVAHALADYMRGARFGGKIDRLLEKIVHALRSIRDALGIKGFHSVYDIFDDLDAGALAARDTGELVDGNPMAALSAADNPIPRQDYLQDPDWKSVQEADVPYAAGWRRFDPSWLLGKSKSAATRLLGMNLIDNVVGLKSHAVNPFSADLRKSRVIDKYQGEFNRFRVGTFEEWGDALKLGPAERRVRQSEFFEQTGLYIRGVIQPHEAHPAVKKFGDATRKILSDIREDFNNPLRHEGLVARPLSKDGDMAENEKYLARLFNHDNVRDAIELYGLNGVVKMVRGAIKDAQPDIDSAVLDKLAHGYVVNMDKQARGLADDWGIALGTGDRAKLAAALRADVASITDQEIDYILARVMPEGDGGTMSHLKSRVLLSEHYVERGIPTNTNGVPDGSVADLPFHALLQNDVTKVMDRYINRSAGRLSLAQMRIELPERAGLRTEPDGSQVPHPTPGHVVLDGLTSDTEIRDLIQRVKEYGTDLQRRDPSYTFEMRDREIEALEWHLDRILGIPNPKQLTEPAWWMRMMRGLMTMRLLGQVGVAQMGETGTVVGTLGLKASATQLPAFKRITSPEGESILSKEHGRYLESIGIGVERLHGLRHAGIENLGDGPFGTSKAHWKEIAQDTIRVGERATYELSGMSFIQQQQERAAAAWIAQDWANIAMKMKDGGKPDRGWLRRAAQLGISEPIMQRIFREMSEHANFKEGYFFGDRVESLNAHLWQDLEAKAHFENAIYRYVRKLIQKGSQGSVPRFMQEDPLLQTLFQFRTFPFTAWANQLQYGLHMLDHRTFNAFTWSLVWNGMVRYAQVQALAAGRADRDKYLEEKLSWKQLAAAGFSRSGWSSIMPMAIDTGLLLGGNRGGLFDQRSSGQASNIVFGSPTLSFIDSGTKGIGGLANSAFNMRAPSQGEARNAFNMLPFSNLMPIAQGYSYMISGLPEKAPSKRQSPGPLQ